MVDKFSQVAGNIPVTTMTPIAVTPLLTVILSFSVLQKNPIRVSLIVSVTFCSPPAIPRQLADIVDEDKRTRYTEDGSGIRDNP